MRLIGWTRGLLVGGCLGEGGLGRGLGGLRRRYVGYESDWVNDESGLGERRTWSGRTTKAPNERRMR